MRQIDHFFKKCGKSIKIRKKDGFAANPGLPQIRVCRKFTKMRQTRICGKPGFAANPDLRQIDVNPEKCWLSYRSSEQIRRSYQKLFYLEFYLFSKLENSHACSINDIKASDFTFFIHSICKKYQNVKNFSFGCCSSIRAS